MPRELLTDLFGCREIDRVQFAVGCVWQTNMNWAAIQPPKSFEWNLPLHFQQLYQHNGDLVDGQGKAVDRRNRWRVALGRNRSTTLDYLLAPEMTRRTLVDRHGRFDASLLVKGVVESLTAFAICIGARTPEPATYKLGVKWPSGEDITLLGWDEEHKGYTRDKPEKEVLKTTLYERQKTLFAPIRSSGRNMKSHWFNPAHRPAKYSHFRRDVEAVE